MSNTSGSFRNAHYRFQGHDTKLGYREGGIPIKWKTLTASPFPRPSLQMTMKATVRLGMHCGVGLVVTLLSSFAGERSALVVYPDIMGCESGCTVVATGWPLIFITDYLGMSVVKTADISEVWFGADRLSWLPFLINFGVWTVVSLVATRLVVRQSTGNGFSSLTDR